MDAWRRLASKVSTHVAAWLITVTALACTPPEPEGGSDTSSDHPPVTTEQRPVEPSPPKVADPGPPKVADPGPPKLRYAEIPAGHQQLVEVSQVPPYLEEGLWFFVADRPLLYADSGDECVMFDIPSGRIVSRSRAEATCNKWLAATHDPSSSRDDAPEVVDHGATLEILGADGQSRQTLTCAGCEYVAHAWAPDNHRIATLVLDPPRLEIWDADAGVRLEQRPLTLPGEAIDATLGWNERGVVTLVEHEAPGAAAARDKAVYLPHDRDVFGHEVSAWFWPSSGAIKKPVRVAKDTTLGELVVDPSVRWLFEYKASRTRDGRDRRRLSTIPLTDEPSALNWSWTGPHPGYEVEIAGRWRADASTQWIETRIDTTQTGQRAALTMSWRAIVTEPEPSTHGQRIYQAGSLAEDWILPGLSVFGVAKAKPLLHWTVDGVNLRAEASAPHCKPLDAAPQLRHMLAACTWDMLALVDLDELDDDETLGVVMRLGIGRKEAEFVWGRSGWLAIRGSTGRLLLVDPQTLTIRLERSDVDALVKVSLGPNLDRFGILVGDRFELIDGNSGKTVLELPGFEGRAGLHPDGQRLAAIIAGQAQVIDIASGKLLASWAEPKLIDLAWRQDGAALLVGAGVPKRMVDANTGELLASLTSGVWELLTPEGLDPSWRWAHLPDGRILRTIDGMTSSFGPNWVRLDSGLFEGKLDQGSEAAGAWMYLAGDDPLDDPLEVPHLGAAAVKPWLEREGLLVDFLAGETIAPASIPEVELARLAARDSRR